LKINHKIQLLKKLPKTSLDPPGTEGLLSSLSPEELAIIKKYAGDVNELKSAFEKLIPKGMGFNLLLEKQIALLQNAESNTELLVQRFDILEQRAKGINEAFRDAWQNPKSIPSLNDYLPGNGMIASVFYG